MKSVASIDGRGKLTVEGLAVPVPWWSFTKTVLAVAALRLVDRDRLSLTKSLDGKPYSLIHLLRHEAGLRDYGGLAQYHADVDACRPPWPVADLLAAADAGRLLFEPGCGWAYSNIGYFEVGRLVERVSDQNLGEALDRLVFAPAGLVTARLAREPADLAEVRMGNATGYHPGWVYHGLVTGTTAEAARMLHMLLSGSLLKPDTLAKMTEGRALPEHRNGDHPDPAYGLGLMMSATEPRKHAIGHTGAGPGSGIAVYAQGGQTCAVWAAPPCETVPMAEIRTRLASASPGATGARATSAFADLLQTKK